jgi:hypothetical protein
MVRREPAFSRLATMSETELQTAIVQAAEMGGWLVYHTHNSQHSAEGFPDLVLVREVVIFAELKREGQKPTPAQQQWLARLVVAGVMAFVWRPSDLDQVAAALITRDRAAAAERMQAWANAGGGAW